MYDDNDYDYKNDYRPEGREDDVSFGYQRVSRNKKKHLVQGVFKKVAQKYDLMNDIMSFGMHRLWKKIMVDDLLPDISSFAYIVDVASGTGDIALSLLNHHDSAHIVAVDINAQMFCNTRRGLKKHMYSGRFEQVLSDATCLPFCDEMFDIYTIAFGLRNMPSIEKTLSEAYRVLKNGGIFLCLEFSHVNLPYLRDIYEFYSFHIMPKLGTLIAHDASSYQYLVESIRCFPAPAILEEKMRAVHFTKTSFTPFMGGMVCFHKGFKECV